MVRITYLGHSAFQIETGEHKLLIDPFISGNPLATASADELEADYILLTHGHGDHLGDAIPIAKRTGATIIAPFELAMHCAGQGASVHPMHIGGGFNFPFGRVKLTQALHGSASGESADRYTGNPCGFVLFLDGKTIYHAGDTGLFRDMELIGSRHPLDAALLPIGDNFTMGPDDALMAARLLKPKMVVPMHYNTFDVIQQDPAAFCSKVTGEGMVCKVLGVGESLDV